MNRKSYIIPFTLLLLLATVLYSCSEKGIPSLKETYSRNDKNPFGTYVAWNGITQLFYNNDIKASKTAFEKSLNSNYDTGSVYISISKNLYLTDADRQNLTAFADRGNSVFISCENFDTGLLNTLSLKVKDPAFLPLDFFNQLAYTSVKLKPYYFTDSNSYSYYYEPFTRSFNILLPGETRTLGVNENGSPNFIVVFYGKGKFFLHCEPRAFSNYFLMRKHNDQYLQHAFSFLPALPEHVFWDDFYCTRNTPPHEGDSSNSTLKVLLSYPAMAWAFWLTLGSLLLFLIFGSKRKQRIIKPLSPNTNTTVAFTETISMLYLQRKDNRNMADKMILFLYEHIRNQHFMNTQHINDDFINTLSRKANVPLEHVQRLFSHIKMVQQQYNISDQELLLLNYYIEKFYKIH